MTHDRIFDTWKPCRIGCKCTSMGDIFEILAVFCILLSVNLKARSELYPGDSVYLT